MSDDVNQTNVSDNAAVNIGASGSTFVPVEGRRIALPSDVHPTAVVATTDAPAETANSRPIDGFKVAQIPTMPSLQQLDKLSTDMNMEDIQNYDGSLEMLEDEDSDSKMPAGESKLPADNTK